MKSFTAYVDFNCAFCHALNERLHALGLENEVEIRGVRKPLAARDPGAIELLGDLADEVAEVRRRSPSTPINLPLLCPDTSAAWSLSEAVEARDPAASCRLRRQIFRALWVDGEDISDPKLLSRLLSGLGIEAPSELPRENGPATRWQSEWERQPEYEKNLPVVVSRQGETLAGFPLQPELDSFLRCGTLLSDGQTMQATDLPERQRILVLDDDLASLRMVIEQMRDTQVELAGDFAALVASALNHGMPDLVIVNTALIGGIDGTDWWRNSTDSDIEVPMPIIFVSDDKSTEAEVAAFEAGAADYISRPFHPKVLRARLNMHLQSRKSQQQLNNIARVDSLTSICNRREFDTRLLSEWGRGARAGHPLALLMIDIDKFKEYNDCYGHLCGDDCLVTVAGILQDCMQRSGDLVARYGGEEFVALLPQVDLEGALTVARDCLAAINEAAIPHPASPICDHVTISIGVAAMQPIYDKSCTLLIEQADIALYQSKQSGRNQVCVFDLDR